MPSCRWILEPDHAHLENGKHTLASDCNRWYPIFGKSGPEYKAKMGHLRPPKMAILSPRMKQGP